MLINKHIGFDATDGPGIDGADFQSELLELDGMGKTAIQVWINSPGGVVMDGYNIFNAILKSKTPVDTYNGGIAASIAGVIFMAGRKRVMSDYASLMVHNPFGGDDKKQINAMRDSLVTMLSAKANIPEPEVSYLMDRTTWLNSAECYAKGFCTDIEKTKDENRKRMPVLNAETTIAEAKYAWSTSNLILNTIFQQTDNIKMKSVTNKLGLVDGSNEESITAAVDAVINRANTAENSLTVANTALQTAEQTIAALKAENKELTDAAAADAQKTADDQKAANVAVFNTVIDKAVAVGKIKVEEKNTWLTTAEKLGYDEAKDLIEKLPLNKTMAKAVEVVGGGTGDGLKNTAGRAMAAVRDKLGM